MYIIKEFNMQSFKKFGLKFSYQMYVGVTSSLTCLVHL